MIAKKWKNLSKKIGIQKYSFHFKYLLNLLYHNIINIKLYFINDDKDVTEDCIQEFANFKIYFGGGGFEKLLNNKNEYQEIDYIKDLFINI